MYEICRSTIEYDNVCGSGQLALQLCGDSCGGSVERRLGFKGEENGDVDITIRTGFIASMASK